MPSFRKKPVVVDAHQVTDYASAVAIRNWVESYGGRALTDKGVFNNGGGMLIETLEGSMIAKPGWWVIKGVQNEFYPCAPDIFEATYEPVAAP